MHFQHIHCNMAVHFTRSSYAFSLLVHIYPIYSGFNIPYTSALVYLHSYFILYPTLLQ